MGECGRNSGASELGTVSPFLRVRPCCSQPIPLFLWSASCDPSFSGLYRKNCMLKRIYIYSIYTIYTIYIYSIQISTDKKKSRDEGSMSVFHPRLSWKMVSDFPSRQGPEMIPVDSSNSSRARRDRGRAAENVKNSGISPWKRWYHHVVSRKEGKLIKKEASKHKP